MTSTSRYRAEIEQIGNDRCPEAPLFHYAVLDGYSGESVFEGVAADMSEAVASINAWLNYSELPAAA